MTAKKPVKRRIPKKQPLVFLSLDFAATLGGHKPGHVPDNDHERVDYLANELQRAADLYYRAADLEATRQSKRGGQQKTADIAFIYAMSHIFEHCSGNPNFGWRSYSAYRTTSEKATVFQEFCNLWIEQVDPVRQGSLKPSSFKAAQAQKKLREFVPKA